TQAALALRAGHPAQAVERLEAARRGETGDQAALWPAYLRGLAYLDQGALSDAQVEFQRVLDHRGGLAPAVFTPAAPTLVPRAQPAHARTAARMGRVDESRKDYETLLAQWKDADADLVVARTARREQRQLAPSASLTR